MVFRKYLFLIATTLLILSGCATDLGIFKKDLLKDQQEQKLHGYLGVSFVRLTQDMRDILKVPQGVDGLAVYAVGKETPGDKAGLRPGDIVQKINGTRLQEVDQIGQYPPETAVSFEVWRNGDIKTYTTSLAYRDAYLGIHASPSSFVYGGVQVKGLIIDKVEKDSPFYETYFKAEANGEKMRLLGIRGDSSPPLVQAGRAGPYTFHWLTESTQYSNFWVQGKDVYNWKGEPKTYEDLSNKLSEYRGGDIVRLLVGWSYNQFLSGTWVDSPWEFRLRLVEKEPDFIPVQYLASPTSSPRTYVVSKEGSGDFKSAEVALLKSSPGDTILLRSGNYSGFGIPFSKRTMRGEGDKTVVEWINIAGVSDVKVENLSVIQKTDKYTNMIINKASNISLKDITVQGGKGAIEIRNSEAVSVDHCRISDAKWGVALRDKSTAHLSNSFISNNEVRGDPCRQ